MTPPHQTTRDFRTARPYGVLEKVIRESLAQQAGLANQPGPAQPRQAWASLPSVQDPQAKPREPTRPSQPAGGLFSEEMHGLVVWVSEPVKASDNGTRTRERTRERTHLQAFVVPCQQLCPPPTLHDLLTSVSNASRSLEEMMDVLLQRLQRRYGCRSGIFKRDASDFVPCSATI